MTLTAGKSLRILREKRGFTMRDVESYTAKISARYRNQEFSIPPSRLADIEGKNIVPSCYRIYSLSVLYALPLTEVMSMYGIPASRRRPNKVNRARALHSEFPAEPFRRSFLRSLRESLGMTMRDVEQLSAKIAEECRNGEFSIPPSRLSDIESKGILPSIYRMYSLAAIYQIEISQLLHFYGIDTRQYDVDRALLGLSAADLEVTFSPELTPAQVTLTLQSLAEYYRACGGMGFEIDFEREELLIREPEYV